MTTVFGVALTTTGLCVWWWAWLSDAMNGER